MDNDFTCFCVGVTEKTIKEHIKNGAKTVEEVSKKTECGTHCGSCKPKIQKLIDQSK